MTDVVSKNKRSETMRAIKSKDSEIEINFRKRLWQKGFRFRKNDRNYFGKPDLVLSKYKTVIFIDSCFWHGCRRHLRMPSSNKKYWQNKIERNRGRDKVVNSHYKKTGWRVIRVWEHDIKNGLSKIVDRVVKQLSR